MPTSWLMGREIALEARNNPNRKETKSAHCKKVDNQKDDKIKLPVQVPNMIRHSNYVARNQCT